TVLPIQNALMTVENTDPGNVPWLTNHFETLLSEVWYPCTVATQSRAIKQIILAALERTGTPELIDFKLHDFGFRGVSSPESAALGGLAHLVNFMGTDTMAALQLGKYFYDEPCAGYSIPASEHSTITSWGKDKEVDAYRNMIKQYGNFPLYACVSDSWDIMNACDIWGTTLKEEVLAANGTLVVRPDSGDPPQVVLDVIKRLMSHFGHTTNSKGFDVLNDKVRVIQGDGVNIDSIGLVLRTLEANGISADNVAFGMGGALLQKLNRDTQCFAFKCSSTKRNGHQYDVFKQPATDPMKNSKKGRFAVCDGPHGHIITVPEESWFAGPNYLRKVFENGMVTSTTDFQAVRARAAIKRSAGL
ncbi:MAG: nicotinate phosphoribosyltransferase, partial [Bacteroidales bacterium]|nr:nicotinate phosphoribosyltransferase [Candidatus Latescibacterota bacterium]